MPQNNSNYVESSDSVQRVGNRVGNYANTDRVGKESLKCIYTNLDGISNKVGEFQSIVNKVTPDLIFLTETKGNESLLSSNIFDTSRFKVYSRDRPTPLGAGIWGGGVAILVRSDLVSDDVYVDQLNRHQAEESVWWEVML